MDVVRPIQNNFFPSEDNNKNNTIFILYEMGDRSHTTE